MTYTDGDPVFFTRYTDKRLEIDVSTPQFDVLNASAIEREGENLFDLAAKDPNRTYRLIKAMMAAVVKQGTLRNMSVNDIVIADIAHESRDTIQNIAYRYVETLPDEFDGPFEFSLGVHYSSEDRELFGLEADDRSSLIELTVRPPDLAG